MSRKTATELARDAPVSRYELDNLCQMIGSLQEQISCGLRGHRISLDKVHTKKSIGGARYWFECVKCEAGYWATPDDLTAKECLLVSSVDMDEDVEAPYTPNPAITAWAAAWLEGKIKTAADWDRYAAAIKNSDTPQEAKEGENLTTSGRRFRTWK